MPVGRPISLTPNIATKTLSATATADQTSFTVTGGYRINELGVYRNGVRLVQGKDFTASDGSTVTLLSGAVVDDTIDFVVFDSFNIADAINSYGNQSISGNLTVTKIIGDGSELTGIGTDNINTNNIKVSGISTLGTETTVVGSAVTFDASGGTVVGVLTATSFEGDGSSLRGVVGTSVTTYIDAASVTSSGIVTITNTTTSTSTSTGALIVSGGVGIAKSLFVGENVSIGGTLTYEDVTNVDSVGVITARLGVIANAGRGIQVTAGGLNVDAGIGTFDAGVTVAGGDFKVGTAITSGGTTGIATFAAITHFDQGIFLNGNNPSREKIYTAGTALNGEFDFHIEDGMVEYCSTAADANFTPDIKVNGSVSLNSVMDTGDIITLVLVTAVDSASHYCSAVKIDNSGVSVDWRGGAISAAGGSDGFDYYTFTIIKTGNNAYKVWGTQSNFT